MYSNLGRFGLFIFLNNSFIYILFLSDDDNLDCVYGSDASKSKSLSNRRFDPECTANPYPVTIIPRFGAMSQPKHSSKDRIVLRRPGDKSTFYNNITQSQVQLPTCDNLKEQL